MKKILIVGKDARAHAIATALAKSNLYNDDTLYAIPGNPGIGLHWTNVGKSETEFGEIAALCLMEGITTIVVSAEGPLVHEEGIADFFANHKDSKVREIKVIAPTKAAAQLEASKLFAKQFMLRHNIPTAMFEVFENHSAALEYVSRIDKDDYPIVIKADGLAAGKGVTVATTFKIAEAALWDCFENKIFGDAGKKVIIEEFLNGLEMSAFFALDGTSNYITLPTAMDYKRLGVGNVGPNTGGMGAISPVPFADDAIMEKIQKQIVEPLIAGMQKEGTPYKGFLYVQVMIVDGEPYVVEFNCRLGDPEAEVILPRIESDFGVLIDAIATGTLSDYKLKVSKRHSAGIILAANGYPTNPEKGKLITYDGLKDNPAALVFFAGVELRDRKLYTNGGRVMCVQSLGDTLKDAVSNCWNVHNGIRFEGKTIRGDVGQNVPETYTVAEPVED